MFFGSVLVSWAFKKQHIVSRSSREVEYRAVAHTTVKLQWIQNILMEMGVTQSCSPVLFCDNVWTIYLIANPLYHFRTKHLELDFHFVLEIIANGKLHIQYVPTELQLVDMFTKSLGITRFTLLRDKLDIGLPC